MYWLAVLMLCVLGGVSAYVVFSRVIMTCWKLARDAKQVK